MYHQFELAVTSIRTYCKPKDALPNPKGPLLQSIPSQAIVLPNIDNDRENCGAPSHKLALRQLLPSILPDKCGSIEYSLSNSSMRSCFTFTVGLRLANTCTVAVQHTRAQPSSMLVHILKFHVKKFSDR